MLLYARLLPVRSVVDQDWVGYMLIPCTWQPIYAALLLQMVNRIAHAIRGHSTTAN